MNRILKSYIATMCGPDGIEQNVTVQVESRPDTPMLDDAGDILQAAQKRCAAGVVDYDSFNSESEYLNTLDARATEYNVVSIRKPGRPGRFAYEGYVGENERWRPWRLSAVRRTPSASRNSSAAPATSSLSMIAASQSLT